jgi:hypothetical protein
MSASSLDQGRAVDGDFVAEEAHFLVGQHVPTRRDVFAQPARESLSEFGFAGDEHEAVVRRHDVARLMRVPSNSWGGWAGRGHQLLPGCG